MKCIIFGKRGVRGGVVYTICSHVGLLGLSCALLGTVGLILGSLRPK
jgi:hypothetical protein